MKDEHFHLVLLMEEAAEVSQEAFEISQSAAKIVQCASKIIRFGHDNVRRGSSLEKLNQEFHDLYTLIEIVNENYGKTFSIDRNIILKKKDKIKQFHKITKNHWKES